MALMLSHLLNLPPMPIWQGIIAPPSSATMLITEQELVRPNAVIDAILRAEKTGRTVPFFEESTVTLDCFPSVSYSRGCRDQTRQPRQNYTDKAAQSNSDAVTDGSWWRRGNG